MNTKVESKRKSIITPIVSVVLGILFMAINFGLLVERNVDGLYGFFVGIFMLIGGLIGFIQPYIAFFVNMFLGVCLVIMVIYELVNNMPLTEFWLWAIISFALAFSNLRQAKKNS